MVPGLNIIVSCPTCGALYKAMTAISGSTFGMRMWTDGAKYFPCMLTLPAVSFCRKCANCFWTDDAQQVGAIWNESEEGPREWVKARFISGPGEDDLQRFAEVQPDRAKEREVRTLAWYRHNDRFRFRASYKDSNRSAQWRANLTRLFELMDEGQSRDCYYRGEIMRELGQFEDAKSWLEMATDDRFSSIARRVGKLCEKKESQLREFHLGD
jgi:hypothetical protein